MRLAARVLGIVWMLACAILWLWIGLIWDWEPLSSFPYLSNWSVITLLQDSKLGLTMVPILLGAIGYALFDWGRRTTTADSTPAPPLG